MMNKSISVNAVSMGGYLGPKNISLDLTNNTPKEMTVDIDPGLIFVPEDTSFQDLVVLGSETIVLAPCQQQEIKLTAFCGKSYARGPCPNLKYHFRKQGDSNLVKTLRYVKANNIDAHLAQYAVWTFTNGHSLNSIYSHENIRMSEDLMKYVAGLKKCKVPDFYVEYKLDNPGSRTVLARGQEKFYVTMHWGAEEGRRNMYLTIYKPDGEVYKNIEADRVIDKYGSTVDVQFDPKVDPNGVYVVKLHDDEGKIWGQKKVVIGLSESEWSCCQELVKH